MSKDKSDLSEQDLERLVRFDDELRDKAESVDDTVTKLGGGDDTSVDSSTSSDALTVEMDTNRLKKEEESLQVEASDGVESRDSDSAEQEAGSSSESEGEEADEETVGKGARALALIHRVQQDNPHVVDDMAAEEANGWLHIEGEHPKRLGRHHIIRRLGSGGFGVVFLAVDPELDRQVALKVPRVETLINGQTRRRFLRESRMAAQLNHPNIATIFEAGTVGPVFYIASEHCPGGSIDQFLQVEAKGGRLDALSTAHVIKALADAVEHAHQRGILHRDIKPSNILLDVAPEELPLLNDAPERMGEVARLVDFGLAKSLEVSEDVTKSGIMLGTPAFTAPEMVTRRHEAGLAADVYSLGATMYHLLTGNPPLKKDSDFETLVATQNEEPEPPSSLATNVHRDLDAICLKCLEKLPEHRYATAGQLRDDLQSFIEGRPVSARSTTRLEKFGRWCRQNSKVAIVAVFTSLLVGLAAGSLIYTWRFTNHLKEESQRIDHERLVFNIHSAFDQDLILGEEIERELWQSSSELPAYGLSPDGRVLLIGFGGKIRFYDVIERRLLEALPVQAQPAAFVQSGAALVASSPNDVLARYPIERTRYDQQIRWEIGTPVEWDGANVSGPAVLATSLDGNLIATSLRQESLKLRDLARQDRIRNRSGVPSRFGFVLF